MLKRQAERDAWAGQLAVQDAGIDARGQIDATIAAQGASGFALNSGSFARKTVILEALGLRDAGRLNSDAAAKVSNSLAEAAQARAAASNAWVKGIFSMGSDLINAGTMANKRRADSLMMDARGVQANG